jgi:CubicO group peptidase (beta-lactamase class C family)
MTIAIHGFCDDRFRAMRDAFEANFTDGLELGSSLAMTHRGRTVVDLWAGWADPEQKKPWKKDTIVQVFSTTKIPLIMCVLMLIDRGKLKLDLPVAHYWPEFGQGGKDKVTLRDFLTHQGGIPAFVPPVSFEDLHDFKRMTAQLAAQQHRFGGRTVLCYHPVSYGFVLGELIRRVDGRIASRFLRQELARRAKADFHMGLSSWWDIRRVAQLKLPDLGPPPAGATNADLFQEIMNSADMIGGDLMSWKHLSALIPSANGYGNGRSIAHLCAILALKGRLGWRRYLSKRIVAEASRTQVEGDDLYIGSIRWGLGFGLSSAAFPGPSATAFHWGGAGGSWGVADPAARVSFGYAPNNFLSGAGAAMDPRLAKFNAELSKLLPGLSR